VIAVRSHDTSAAPLPGEVFLLQQRLFECSPWPTDEAQEAALVDPLTADDILQLVVRLSPEERQRLFRPIAAASKDVEAYGIQPPHKDEFSSDDAALEWESGGWENVG
jgi:hypothetical protein